MLPEGRVNLGLSSKAVKTHRVGGIRMQEVIVVLEDGGDRLGRLHPNARQHFHPRRAREFLSKFREAFLDSVSTLSRFKSICDLHLQRLAFPDQLRPMPAARGTPSLHTRRQ